ncbi:MAG: hypothetical protein PF481_00775 [Bacteroidales bacterium]|jgi:hypothetical protein|nr:hypothetical protein [Bacteroidales bacterium]
MFLLFIIGSISCNSFKQHTQPTNTNSFKKNGVVYDTAFLQNNYLLLFSKTDSLYFIRLQNKIIDTVFHSHPYPQEDVSYQTNNLFRDYDSAFSIITNALDHVWVYDKKTCLLLQKGTRIRSNNKEQRYLFLQKKDKESLIAFDMVKYTIETYPFYPETPLGKRWSNGIHIETISDTSFHINAYQIDGSNKKYIIKRTNKPQSVDAFIKEL